MELKLRLPSESRQQGAGNVMGSLTERELCRAVLLGEAGIFGQRTQPGAKGAPLEQVP